MTRHSDQVHTQLERLCASAEFARSERMVRFLRFIVEQSLVNGAQSLRERQIGIEVFDRPNDWDPKLDNIVRSEARRLRAKLEAYAAGAPADETIRITVPKGAYFAEFEELRPTPTEPDLAGVPHLTKELAAKTHSLHSTAWLLCTRVAAGVAVAALVLFAFVKIWHEGRVNASRLDNFDIVPVSNEIGQQFSPSISPDGNRVAYVWDGNGNNFDIYVKTLSTGAVSRVTTGAAAELHPAWSPDSSHLAFLRHAEGNDELVVRDVKSGSERVVTHVRDTVPMSGWASNNPLSGCQNLAWSRDGSGIVLADSLEGRPGLALVRVDVASGAEHALTRPSLEDEDCYPHTSPDGARIAFVRYISHGVSDIFTVGNDGSQEEQLTHAYATVRGLDWSADGSRLIFASPRRGSYELRAVSSAGGASYPIPADTNSASDPAIARDGRWMTFVDSTENWNIWRVPISDHGLGKPERLLASAGHNHSPSVSPDGTRIAFVSDRSGSPEIWFAAPDGSHLRQMTHYGGPWLGTIRWSPDGRSIVFDARPNGHAGIFSMPAEGGQPTTLVQDSFEARRPFWSRDGRSLYFDITRTGAPQIWKRDLQTGNQHVLGPRDYIALQESLDGKTVYFSHNPSDDRLWSADPDGTHPAGLDTLRPDPVLDWSVGAKGVYFTRNDSDSANFYLYSYRDRTVHELGRLPQVLSLGTPSLAVSPDEHWLYYAAIDQQHSDIKLRQTIGTASSAP